MFLPDRYIREPALLVPGRKPRGRVKLSVDGSSFICLCGDGIHRNIRDNAPPTTQNLASAEIIYNRGILFKNSNSHHLTYAADHLQPPSDEFSLFFRFRYDGIDYQVISQLGTADNNVGLLYEVSLNNARIVFRIPYSFNNFELFAATLVNGQTYDILCRVKKGTGAEVWVDGVQSATSAYNAAINRSHTNPSLVLGNSLAYNDPTNGLLEHFQYFDRYIADGELFGLFDDPYQFLKPAGSAW